MSVFALIVVLSVAATARAQSVEQQLRKAIQLQETPGKLDAAIAAFEQITAEKEADREYAAKAKYRLLMCYMKLEQTQKALETFDKLLAEFPEQSRQVQHARWAVSVLEGPPDAPTGNYYVSRSEDDAEERVNHDVNLNNHDLDFGQLSGPIETAAAIGMRFDGIRIPKGSKIKRAFLQLTKDVSPAETEPMELTIRAELAANAPAFKEEPKNISSRSMTIRSVTWSPQTWLPDDRRGESQQTPDLSPLIQEVTDQSEWKEGNALVLIITGSEDRGGERDAMSFDGGGTRYGPMLHVETE